eukprot:6208531-Pleurochrysis_carterae.AAC.6
MGFSRGSSDLFVSLCRELAHEASVREVKSHAVRASLESKQPNRQASKRLATAHLICRAQLNAARHKEPQSEVDQFTSSPQCSVAMILWGIYGDRPQASVRLRVAYI